MSLKDTLKKQVAPVVAAAATLVTPMAAEAGENAAERNQNVEYAYAALQPAMKKVAPDIAKEASRLIDKTNAFKRCGAENLTVIFRPDGHVQITGTSYSTDGNGLVKPGNEVIILDEKGNEVGGKVVSSVNKKLDGTYGDDDGIHVYMGKDGNYMFSVVTNTPDGRRTANIVHEGQLGTLDHASNAIENAGDAASNVARKARDLMLGR